MAKKYQRRKKRKTKKQAISRKYWIFASLGLLVAALSAFIYHEKIHIKTSYSVSEIATVNPGEDTLLYPYLFKVQTKKITSVTNLAVEGYLLTSYKGEQITFAKVRYEDRLYYIKANQLKITQSNSINAYIASLNYPHEQIDNQINNAFAKKAYATSNAKPKGVLIHDTDNDRSDINDEINYMAKNYQTQGIFVHAFIDNTRIVQIADNQYMAQGAGPKANPYYIQFEMTRLTDADSFARQLANAAYYTAYMLHKYQLPVTLASKDGSCSLWTHALASEYLGGTDHQDPEEYWSAASQNYFGTDYGLEQFRDLVQVYYNQF